MRDETLALHSGFDADPATNAVAVPIYQTAAYQFDSADHGAALFNLEQEGYRYSRIANPTVTVLHRKGASSQQQSQRMTLAFYRSMYLFYAKHYRGRTSFVLDWLIVGGIYLRMAWSLARNALRPAHQRRVST